MARADERRVFDLMFDGDQFTCGDNSSVEGIEERMVVLNAEVDERRRFGRSRRRREKWQGASRAARRTPRMREDEGDESLAVQLLVQARDGLIPIETFAVANEDDLVLIN